MEYKEIFVDFNIQRGDCTYLSAWDFDGATKYHIAEWIFDSEILPKHNQDVWIYDGKNVLEGWYFDKGGKVVGFTCGNGIIDNVVCWQPMYVPEPPEDSDE